MSNLFEIEKLTKEEILKLFSVVKLAKIGQLRDKGSHLGAANIFNEPSTRTYASFKMAQHHLGMQIIDIFKATSSFTKNETLSDTIEVLIQYGINNFVIRDSQEKFYEQLDFDDQINVINGGDGTNQHPTQALLDLYTLWEYFDEDLNGKTIAFLGDLKSSRVYHSHVHIFKLFGAKLVSYAPQQWDDHLAGVEPINDKSELTKVDIFSCYRIQNERHKDDTVGEANDYNTQYGLNQTLLDQNSKATRFIHPGPVNYGIEISEDIKTSSQSLVLKQVENGMFVRTAILAIMNNLA